MTRAACEALVLISDCKNERVFLITGLLASRPVVCYSIAVEFSFTRRHILCGQSAD